MCSFRENQVKFQQIPYMEAELAYNETGQNFELKYLKYYTSQKLQFSRHLFVNKIFQKQ